MIQLLSDKMLKWTVFLLLWWQAAMDFVVEEDLKAHLTCWYIQKYVKENPQPQYFEHIYQWPYGQRRAGERDSPGDKNTVWHHALELQADIQQRTFQALWNVTLSDSRDTWPHAGDVRALNGSLTRGYRKWISWSLLVITWAIKPTKAVACYLTQKPSGWVHVTDRKQGLGL